MEPSENVFLKTRICGQIPYIKCQSFAKDKVANIYFCVKDIKWVFRVESKGFSLFSDLRKHIVSPKYLPLCCSKNTWTHTFIESKVLITRSVGRARSFFKRYLGLGLWFYKKKYLSSTKDKHIPDLGFANPRVVF